MSEHLLKAGANITPRDGDELTRLPYLRHWFRTKSAIVLHLSNGTMQINFFQVRAVTRFMSFMGVYVVSTYDSVRPQITTHFIHLVLAPILIQ